MKRFFTLLVLVFCVGMVVNAQKDVVITIGKNKFTIDEFERIYKKNNTQLNDQNDVKTPSEYLDMFIDYKLKVIEAEKRGYDTISTFVDELAGYRSELAKPYLTDVNVTEEMIKSAYFRTINEINVSHILIELKKDATPEDTLKAYNKILDIRNQYLNKEKTFEELALDYSEDMSVSQNSGNLGYFNAFKMVTAFEDAAYSTPVGEVSMPVRSPFGYHIILVHDLKPSIGEVKVAHIMKMYSNSRNLSTDEDNKLKNSIDSIYTLLKNGTDFGILAFENSDDKGTSRRKGEMNYISQTFSVKEFANAAFALKNVGDYSEPIKSPFGWHILKLIDRKNPPSFEDVKEELAIKIKKDPVRSKHSIDVFLAKKKKEYGFKVFDGNLLTFKNFLDTFPEDTINNDFPEHILNLPLFQVANTKYSVQSFLEMQKNQRNNHGKYIASILKKHLDSYEEEVIISYESDQLETKYPEFKHIMQEYRDGMLLFSIMQDEVWNKAAIDTVGFNNFYELNKGKYVWGKYFEGLLIRCYNQNAKDSVEKLIAEGITSGDDITSRINTNGAINIKVHSDKWEKGTNDRIDYFYFGGAYPDKFDSKLEFAVGKVKEGGAKTLDESRGLYLSDYQYFLEDEWLKKLRSDYSITINKKLLKKIKSL